MLEDLLLLDQLLLLGVQISNLYASFTRCSDTGHCFFDHCLGKCHISPFTFPRPEDQSLVTKGMLDNSILDASNVRMTSTLVLLNVEKYYSRQLWVEISYTLLLCVCVCVRACLCVCIH